MESNVELVIQIIFFVIAALIIGAAIMVVTVKNIIHAALWLISSFFGVGMLYLLMEAEFLAIAQVLIYVGAVSVLVLFAIMLTRYITGERERQLYKNWWVGLGIAAVLFAVLLAPTLLNQEWTTFGEMGQGGAETPVELANTASLGYAFMQEYLLPFQAAAVLLLIALVGAIVIAFEARTERRVLTLAEQWELRRQQREAQQPASAQPEAAAPSEAPPGSEREAGTGESPA
jgi:NADH-quinone oxidoreductase subunit J